MEKAIMAHAQARRRKANRGSVLIGLAGVLLLVGAGTVATYFLKVQDASAGSEAPVEAASSGVSSEATQAVEAAAQQYLGGTIELQFDERSLLMTRSELGASIDPEAVQREAARLAQAGVSLAELRYDDSAHVPIKVERAAVQTALVDLKSRMDRGPVNARMDLEARKVHPSQAGFGIDLFGSVSAVEVALRTGATSVALEGVALEPSVTIETLGVEDISQVISSFSTKFSVAEKTRNDNLKRLASMIDGYVLQPGEEFSFNAVTGDRTLEDGFKVAHVILAGEMVDGIAGGSCQISTTLHGAAFFGGLDIVRATPHSRPSTYVALGLDATVVAGQVDLKLKNPFDFPVVIHYRVARGEAFVELLGKEKPFDRVEFEREIVQRLDFETVTREDDKIGVGHMVVDQGGYPGYKVKRTRRVYQGKKVLRTDKWDLFYRPVIEYARIGINPNPNLPAPEQKPNHGPKPAEGKFTIVQ